MKEGENVVKLKGPVFTIGVMALRYQWRKAREEIGAADLRIHDLRHQAASAALEKGLTIAELMLLTGHKSLKSLEVYLQSQGVDAVASKLSNV
jgi:integrase